MYVYMCIYIYIYMPNGNTAQRITNSRLLLSPRSSLATSALVCHVSLYLSLLLLLYYYISMITIITIIIIIIIIIIISITTTTPFEPPLLASHFGSALRHALGPQESRGHVCIYIYNTTLLRPTLGARKLAAPIPPACLPSSGEDRSGSEEAKGFHQTYHHMLLTCVPLLQGDVTPRNKNLLGPNCQTSRLLPRDSGSGHTCGR